jgi:hypothetical protein
MHFETTGSAATVRRQLKFYSLIRCRKMGVNTGLLNLLSKQINSRDVNGCKNFTFS